MQLMRSLENRLSKFKELANKNFRAFIKSRGFELARIKRRGSTHVATRIIRAATCSLIPHSEPVTIDPERYFTIDIEAKPGINHLRYALGLLIGEAMSLGRTPIVFKPRLDPRHNLGKELDVDWDRYIDLERIKISNMQSGTHTYIRAVQRRDVEQLERLSTAWFERDHLISEDENRRFDVIVRQNKTGLHIGPVHDGNSWLSSNTVHLEPSSQVMKKFGLVKDRLDAYHAMHVRRDDMLEMTDLYPNLDKDTRPDRILRTLLPRIPKGSRIYIMTNERDRVFFDPLRSHFEIFQYFDFPELRDLIESDRPDNFLLFEIEKILFEKASSRIHTFAHPEGAERISLTTDKGWA